MSTNPLPDVDSDELQPPPRWLIIVVVGGIVCTIIGMVGAVIIFQNLLYPSQQQRIISMLPFMELLLPSHGNENMRLPTAPPNANNAISPEDLLNLSVFTLTPMPSLTLTATATPTLTPTSIVTLTATSLPSAIPLVTSTAIVSTEVVPEAFLLPLSARIYGLRGVIQTWNNCGPATITMGLSYFGWTEEQTYAASFLKPNEEDKNVTPSEMVQFVNEQTDIRAITRIGGTLDLVRAFIANGFPVIVSIGYAPEGEDWLGHYRALVGYDNAQGQFFAYDSYLGTGENGAGILVPSSELDAVWQQFNRRFIVLFEPQREGVVAGILGERADLVQMAELALQVAQQEARSDPRNGFAWFNIGTSLVALERYEEAAIAYDRSRQLDLPWRMLWYQFGPYEAYFNVGRYDDVIALVNANLNNGGAYVEETYFWQGKVLYARGERENARTAFNLALAANPLFDEAQEALAILEFG